MSYFSDLQEKALAHAEELFLAADTSKDGNIQLSELRDILRQASKKYPQLYEHAVFLDRYTAGYYWDWA